MNSFPDVACTIPMKTPITAQVTYDLIIVEGFDLNLKNTENVIAPIPSEVVTAMLLLVMPGPLERSVISGKTSA